MMIVGVTRVSEGHTSGVRGVVPVRDVSPREHVASGSYELGLE